MLNENTPAAIASGMTSPLTWRITDASLWLTSRRGITSCWKVAREVIGNSVSIWWRTSCSPLLAFTRIEYSLVGFRSLNAKYLENLSYYTAKTCPFRFSINSRITFCSPSPSNNFSVALTVSAPFTSSPSKNTDPSIVTNFRS